MKIEDLKAYNLTAEEKLVLIAIIEQAQEENTDTIITNEFELATKTECSLYISLLDNLKKKNFIDYINKYNCSNSEKHYVLKEITLTKKALNILHKNTENNIINAEGKRTITIIL